MKKFLSLCICFVMILSLAACGVKKTADDPAQLPSDVPSGESEKHQSEGVDTSGDTSGDASSLGGEDTSEPDTSEPSDVVAPVFLVPSVRPLSDDEVDGVLDLIKPFDQVDDWDTYTQTIYDTFAAGHSDWEGHIWRDEETGWKLDEGERADEVTFKLRDKAADIDYNVVVGVHHKEDDPYQLIYAYISVPISTSTDDVMAAIESCLGHPESGFEMLRQYIDEAKTMEGQNDDVYFHIKVGENMYFKITGTGYSDAIWVNFDMFDNLADSSNSMFRLDWQNWMPKFIEF